MGRVAVLAPSVAALIVAAAYAVALAPGRLSYFGDQGHYENLARILASTGRFARVIGEAGPVPEPVRSIGYPGFLAIIYRLTGVEYPAVLVVQLALCASLPALAYLLARPLIARKAALAAAWAGAAYVPFAYYAAFTLSDLLATVLVATGSVLHLRAIGGAPLRTHVLSGALLGLAGLVRPSLLVLGIVLAVPVLRGLGKRFRGVLPPALAVIAFLAVGVLPSAAYTYASFGRLGVNAAGGGIGVWYGYWQGTWSGKTTEAILAAGYRATSDADLEVALGALGVDVPRAASYVREFKGLGTALEAGATPSGLPAYLAADVTYRSLAEAHTRDDLAGWLARGLLYRSPVLWLGEVPVAQDRVADVPPPALLALWLAQLLLAGLATIGLAVLLRSMPWVGLSLALGLGALWLAHFAYSAEARYSLPVKTWLIVLAVVGARSLWARRRAATSSVNARLGSPRTSGEPTKRSMALPRW